MRLYICAFENCLFAQRYNSLTLNIICWAAQARVYSLRQGCGCVSFARENRLYCIYELEEIFLEGTYGWLVAP